MEWGFALNILKKLTPKSTGGRIALISVTAVVLVIAILAGLFYYYFGGLQSSGEMDTENLSINSTLPTETGIVNVALFGIDKAANNSDVIMILSLNYDKNEIKLISIARDTRANIPGYGERKINTAYTFGGPQLAIQTLNNNFHLNIKDYVTVDFEQFKDVIDALGGVTVEITEAERKAANGLIYSTFGAVPQIQSSGEVHLNGTQALCYSRIRKLDSDNVRTQRQKKVLLAVLAELRTKNVLEYPGIIKSVLPMVTTSFDYFDLMGMSQFISITNIQETFFPHEKNEAFAGMAYGYWYYIYDLDQAADMIHAFIYEDIHPDNYGESSSDSSSSGAASASSTSSRAS